MFSFDLTYDIQAVLNQFWWQINFLLLVLIVVLGYLAVKKPAYAAGLTIILLPTYLFRSSFLGIPFTFLELCILINFLGWVIRKLRDWRLEIKKIFKLTSLISNLSVSYLLPITAILLGATFSIFFAPSMAAAAGIWKAYFIEPVLFFIVLSNLLKDQKNKEVILWSLGISTLTISLLAVYQKLTGFGIAQPAWIMPSQRRVTSLFTSPNAVGLFLAPIMLICLGWLVERIKRLEIKRLEIKRLEIKKITFANAFIVFVILLSGTAVFFTVSQGTWLGLAAGLVFFSFFALSKKWTTAAVLIGLIAVLAMPITRDKFMPVVLMQDASGQNRLVLWNMAKDQLLSSPANFIFGTGLTGFADIQNKLRDPLKMEALLYPHNILLNFWLETGLLGLIGFIWLVVLFFRKGLNNILANGHSPLRIGILAAMVCLIVHGLIDVPYFKNDLAVLFWVLIGLL